MSGRLSWARWRYLSAHGASEKPQDLTIHVCINVRLPTHGGLLPWDFKKATHELNVRVDGSSSQRFPTGPAGRIGWYGARVHSVGRRAIVSGGRQTRPSTRGPVQHLPELPSSGPHLKQVTDDCATIAVIVRIPRPFCLFKQCLMACRSVGIGPIHV
jgi:hypothetical protein